MPRPKKPQTGASIVRKASAVSLSDDVKDKLFQIVGTEIVETEQSKMIILVEDTLGAYPGWVETMDNAPTHASVAIALGSIQKKANSLRCKLLGLDGVSENKLEIAGFRKKRELIRQLIMLETAIKGFREEPIESRGGKSRQALHWVIIFLGDLYCTYASEPNRDGLLNFVTDSLDAAKITYEDNDFRLLKDLPLL